MTAMATRAFYKLPDSSCAVRVSKIVAVQVLTVNNYSGNGQVVVRCSGFDYFYSCWCSRAEALKLRDRILSDIEEM